MCGGGGESYDIEEAARMEKEEALNSNIQISSVMRMMQDSEPELFGGGDATLMTTKLNQHADKISAAKILMHQWTRWHANLQIKFWQDFYAIDKI